MTTKYYAETSAYLNIFHHVTATTPLPKIQTNHGHHLKAEMNIWTFLNKVRNYNNNLMVNIPTDSKNNFSTKQRRAVKDISTYSNIVVMQADMRGAIAIINTSDCISDCTLLLNDAKTYQTTSSDKHDKHVTVAINLVNILTDSNRQIILDLLPDQQRAGIFYG